MIQTPYKCKNFKHNDNLNLTCEQRIAGQLVYKRCKLITEDRCYEFEVQNENRNN